MKDADAVIILCNKTSPNPDDEDSKNITRYRSDSIFLDLSHQADRITTTRVTPISKII